MPSKLLVTCTALALVVLSLTFLFAPAEALAALSPAGGGGAGLADGASLIAQLYAAALLGLAGLNWASRREIACGAPSCTLPQTNFVHFTAGALVLVKPALQSPSSPLLSGLAVYALFSLLYGWVLWGPKERQG